MKKLLAIVILSCVLFSVVSSSAEQIDVDNVLIRVGTIVEIDEENDVVVVMDTVGMLWAFEGIEDYMLDDTVALLIFFKKIFKKFRKVLDKKSCS